MRNIWIIILLLMALSFAFGLIFGRAVLTGRAVQENEDIQTWTKAICNSENECVDVLISCRNKNVDKIELVSGAVKHGDDWKDLRGGFSDILC